MMLKCVLMLAVCAISSSEAWRDKSGQLPIFLGQFRTGSTRLVSPLLDRVDQEQQSRFLISRSTITSTTYQTTSDTCTTTKTCATSNAVLPACRRRRDLNIDGIAPTLPIAMETTVMPHSVSNDGPQLETSVAMNEPTEALIVGLADCVSARRNFGVTVLFTSVVTLPTTCKSFETKTTAYTIMGCKPAGIAFC